MNFSKTLAFCISIGIFIILLIFSFLVSLITTHNKFIEQEKSIQAQYDQNKNNYDNFFKKVKEVSQVPDMYTNDLKKVYDSTMTGRYGDKGSQAVFQFIREHNPNFDSSLYKQIQQVIEAGRNDFEQNQKMLIDKKRTYETLLTKFPTNFISSILGFPKIDLNKINIVTSDITEQVFNEKKSDPIKIR